MRNLVINQRLTKVDHTQRGTPVIPIILYGCAGLGGKLSRQRGAESARLLMEREWAEIVKRLQELGPIN